MTPTDEPVGPEPEGEDAIARVRDLADNLSERYDHREHWVETVLALLDSERERAERAEATERATYESQQGWWERAMKETARAESTEAELARLREISDQALLAAARMEGDCNEVRDELTSLKGAIARELRLLRKRATQRPTCSRETELHLIEQAFRDAAQPVQAVRDENDEPKVRSHEEIVNETLRLVRAGHNDYAVRMAVLDGVEIPEPS